MMKFQIENGILTRITGKDRELVIPPEVTEIAPDAGADVYDLDKITISGNVRRVGSKAFVFNRVKELVIEEGVEEIGDMAFMFAHVETLSLPQSLKRIGAQAFSSCGQLRKLQLPSGLTELGAGAFHGCENLDGTVTIPEGVTALEEKVFCNCKKLKKVNLPDGLKVIGNNAFVLCGNLQTVNLPDSLEEIGESAFSHCAALTGVKLPEGVRSVGKEAFFRCKALADEKGLVILGDTLYNYYGPGGEVVIPDGVRRVEKMCFYHTEITAVTIPASVERIEEYAFDNCDQLTTVRLPEKLPYIHDSAFEGCAGLVDENGVAVVRDILVAWRKDPERVEIPEGIRVLGSYCLGKTYSFEWNRKNAEKIREVVLPQSLKRIGYGAFLGDVNLAKINFPEGLEEIGNYAFEKCAALAVPELPAGLTAIGDYAFRECPGVNPNMVIPVGVKHLSKKVFEGVALQSISMSKDAFDGWSKDAPAKSNMGVVVRDGEKVRYYAFASKASDDNLRDYVLPGNWYQYDLELINNGPEYKYKAPTRLLGTLGRLADPVALDDEHRELHLDFLIKNAKKLVPLAEALRCPEIIRDMVDLGVINAKNKKAIAKLLAASPVAEIAALADL